MQKIEGPESKKGGRDEVIPGLRAYAIYSRVTRSVIFQR